jgi:phosphate transport system permease protein
MSAREIEERVMKGLMIGSTCVVGGILLFIIATVLVKGLPAFSLGMLTRVPEGGYYLGKEGGILNAILGSVLLGVGATALAGLAGLPVALYLNAYLGKNSRLALLVRFSLDVLWGIPSIVYGAFGFAVLVLLGMRASLLAGTLTVALLILPIVVRSMDEVLKLVPFELKEAAFALGSTRLEMAIRVLARHSLPGLVAALLIAFGRGIGDAASVLFTAGFTDSVPRSLFGPVATLPLAIFYQLGTPFPEVQARGYASAFVLTILVLAVSLVSRYLLRRMSGWK